VRAAEPRTQFGRFGDSAQSDAIAKQLCCTSDDIATAHC